jgi:hypothetical protein
LVLRERLVERARDGDESAFENLVDPDVDRHVPLVRRMGWVISLRERGEPEAAGVGG